MDTKVPVAHPQTLSWNGQFRPCPYCNKLFMDVVVLADHMVIDHWWDRPFT